MGDSLVGSGLSPGTRARMLDNAGDGCFLLNAAVCLAELPYLEPLPKTNPIQAAGADEALVKDFQEE